ncbi:MAG: DNA translocase FtsK [Chloroflexota bacterium]|nr:DNA translocase FtsK [Chloroflexota bacterium]
MTRRKSRFWPLQGLNWEPTPLQREIAALLLIAVALVTLLGLLSISRGVVIDLWVRVLRLLFGWGAYPAALGFGLAGGVLFLKSLHRETEIHWPGIIGWEVAFIALLALLHLFPSPADPRSLANEGGGGGWVGWALSHLLITSLGAPVAALLLLIVEGIGLSLTLRISWPQVREGALRLGETLSRSFRALLRRRTARPESRAPAREASSSPKKKRPSHRRSKSRQSTGPKQPKVELPPLDLLYEDSPNLGSSEAERQRRARIIEETLDSFGVPVKVVDIKPGPVVTQFGVEPGFTELRSGEQRKVRVSKISSLRKDLALALAAAPIRVEAPVPGRHVVGIEVPNGETSLVSLRGVMESEVFENIESPLRIALGRDVSGNPIATDLALMPHLLIAGATGSGKSVCINSIVTCLLFQHPPDTLKLVMVDPKRVELLRFNGLPHLISPVETDAERVVGILKWLNQEMESRYQRFVDAGARRIKDYNQRLESRGGELMPYIVLVIDELADLMMVAPDEIERLLCRLAQMSRATGIHLVIATQRPSVDVVTGLIKANFPARISFATTSQVDSRVILDTGGAEALLGSGDMLFMAPDSSKPIRIQGCFASDEEIENVVHFWKMYAPQKIPAPEEAPWKELEAREEFDPLIEEAIQVVQEHNHASASFLQRKMRVGYPRAARLIDQLEELGVVGPMRKGGGSRRVLIDTDVDLKEAELGTEASVHSEEYGR